MSLKTQECDSTGINNNQSNTYVLMRALYQNLVGIDSKGGRAW